jgi:hypothetical protein
MSRVLLAGKKVRRSVLKVESFECVEIGAELFVIFVKLENEKF